MTIRILPTNLINQIAAGEVIERPYSVVKELVENSIDAGATAITVTLRNGGKSYLAVEDNGCGIAKDELPLALQRHATSKLANEDLFAISTLGFRGEALPSIASIARVTLASQTADQEHAWAIKVEGGVQEESTPASRGVGTKVEVADLFFATPARLKFLKTASSELNQCTEVIKRLALVNPHIRFQVRDEQKKILDLAADHSGETPSLPRAADVIGNNFFDNALRVDLSVEHMSLTGFAGLPTLNRANSLGQYLFVNRRPVKDKLLNVAVRLAYEDVLARDRFPMVVLYLDVAPFLVDMNVHPAKTEVRFRDPQRVRSLITDALKRALASGGVKAAKVDPEKVAARFAAPTSPQVQPRLGYQKRPSTAALMRSEEGQSPGYGQSGDDAVHSDTRLFTASPHFSGGGAPRAPMRQFSEPPGALQQPRASGAAPQDTGPMETNRRLPEDTPRHGCQPSPEECQLEDYPLGYAKAQVFDTFIIAQNRDEMILIDQHAVHERIVYETLKREMHAGGVQKNRLLIPEIVEMTPEERDRLLEVKAASAQLGLVYDTFGESAVMVTETPAILGEFDIKNVILTIKDEVVDLDTSNALEVIVNQVLSTLACHGSIRAGKHMTLEEMNSLLRTMEQSPNTGQCNHGRPTYVTLSKSALGKFFDRT